MKKRLISLLLCLCLLLPAQTVPVLALENTQSPEPASTQAEQEAPSPLQTEETFPVTEEPAPAAEETAPPEPESSAAADAAPEDTPALSLLEQTGERYLSDLTPASVSVGWGSFQRNKNVDGGTIYVNVNGVKTKFDKGIAAHAQANIVYDLGAGHKYNYLSGYFSVDASKAGNANAQILVYTSNDTGSWGYPVFTSAVLTGGNSVPLSTIDITGYRYLRIYCDPLGHNGYDHTVVADAKVYTDTDYVEPQLNVVYTKSDETADKEAIANALNGGTNYSALLNTEATKKALITRMFMTKLGSGSDDYIKNQKAFLTGTDAEISQKKELLQWLKDHPDYMAELLAGGDPEGCTFLQSMNILSRLYAAHKADLSDSSALHIQNPDISGRTKQDVYRTMMFAIALSGNVYAWLDTNALQDPVVRYEKYKTLYNHGTYQLRNEIFENLCVEEMRYVMNVRIWNDEITWLNAYIRNNPKGQSGFPILYSPHRYLRYGKDWDNAAKGYLNEANYATHAATYSLNTYGDDFIVPFSKSSKLWMVFAGSHICWGISYTGTNFAASFGVPSKYVTQPGHGAFLVMNRGSDPNSVTWGIDNNISGWTATSLVGWNLGRENVRTMCGWGIPKNGWVGGNESSYILLSQYALNHEADYTKAELLLSMDSYSGANKEALYNQVLEIMPYHLDAWYGLVKYYTANKSAQEIAALAARLGQEMRYFPLPMHDLMTLLRSAVQNGSDPQKALYLAQIGTTEGNALLAASNRNNVRTGQMQGDVMATMANYLRGNTTTPTLAAFSFDGSVSNSIVIGNTYAGVNYYYSLDGGRTWSEKVSTGLSGTDSMDHPLTAEELSRLSPTDDILIWLDGWTDTITKPVDKAYRIDILAGSTVSGLSQNDKENRFFGTVTGIAYSTDNQTTWQPLTDSTRFEGEKTVYLRKKATGCTMQGIVSGPYHFTENSTAVRSYIPISRLSVAGCSSQETSRQNNAAGLAVDGLYSTLWHTLWDGSDKQRYIILKADAPTFFSGLDYTPRQDGGTNGNITACTIYASMDGTDWYPAGSVSGWASNNTVKHMTFDQPAYGQYLKVVVTGSVGNFASAGAIELFENTTYKDKPITGVRLGTKPSQTSYVAGEVPSISGAKVFCVYADGTETEVPLSMLRVSPSVLNAEGTQTIELTYMSYPTMTYEVTVAKNDRTPTEITVEKQPDKTQYYAGQSLDLTGLVIKAKDASGVWYPEDYTVSFGTAGEDSLQAGEQTITVSYKEKTATFSVTVWKAPASISISTPPAKNEYNIGETLDTTGMVVTLTYEDNTKQELTVGYTVKVDSMALPGEKTLTVTLTDYPAISASTPITVRTNLRDGDFEFDVLMADEIQSLRDAGKLSLEEGKYPCYLSAYTNTQATEVSVPAEVTVNGVTYQVIGVRENAFTSAPQVTSLALPGTVQILESGSLTALEDLENLYLSGVSKISDLSIADGSLPENESGTIYMASSTLSNDLNRELEDYQGLSEGSPVMQTGNLFASNQLSKLEITAPEQNTFELNEALAFSVNVLLKNGLSIPLNESQYTTEGGTAAYGTQTITARMTGTNLSASFAVEVIKTAPVIRVNPKDAMYLSESAEIAPISVAVTGNIGDRFVCQWYYSADSQFSLSSDTPIETASTKVCNGSDPVSYSLTPANGTGYYYAAVWKQDSQSAQSNPAQSMAAHIQIVDGSSYPIIVEGRDEVYKTLADAFTHAASGSVLLVRGDGLTMTSGVSFSQKSFTLKGEKGNTTTINRGNGVTGAMFQLSGTASLKVENLTIDGGAVWDGTIDSVLNRGTVNSGITAADGVFKLSGTSSLELSQNAVLQNAATSGSGAVAYMVDTATLTVDGATVRNCAAAVFGGAFWLERGGKITVKSGTFQGNYSAGYGGVIATNSGAAQETEILGGTFEHNKSPAGGVIFIGGASALTVSGGTFQNNAATNGGVIHNFNGGTVTINGGTFQNNAAKGSSEDYEWENGNGAAIYSAKEKGGKLILNGGVINNCNAYGNGGAIYSGNATVAINGGTIENCSAGYGGAIYSETGKVTMGNGEIKSCTAEYCGGGIDANSAPIEISGGQILDCKSDESGSGAAIHTGDSSTVTITGGIFQGTIKTTKGTIRGGYYSVDPRVSLNAFIASGYLCKEETIDDKTWYHVTIDPATSFSLSLNENIAINFYLIPFENTAANDYTVTATFAGEKTVDGKSLSDMTATEGKYAFTVATTYPYQMTEPVTVQISYQNQVIKECTYSVRDYCLRQIEDSTDTNLVNLCKAVLQYGGDAQRYFKDKTFGDGTAYRVFPTSDESYADVGIERTTPEMPSNTASITGSLPEFGSFSAALILGNEVSMKVYFDYTGEDAISSYTLACNNAKTVSAPQLVSGNTYSVKITGIAPCELSKDFNLSITKGGESMTVTYSPYAFAASKWTVEQCADSLLRNLCQSLVLYGNMAEAYFTPQE